MAGIIHRSRDKVERHYRDSDGYWIELKRGWHVWGEHCIVEDTKGAAFYKVKEARPCHCKECQQ